MSNIYLYIQHDMSTHPTDNCCIQKIYQATLESRILKPWRCRVGQEMRNLVVHTHSHVFLRAWLQGEDRKHPCHLPLARPRFQLELDTMSQQCIYYIDTWMVNGGEDFNCLGLISLLRCFINCLRRGQSLSWLCKLITEETRSVHSCSFCMLYHQKHLYSKMTRLCE